MFNYFLAWLALIACCGFAVATINSLKPIIDKLKPFWQLFTCQMIGAFFGIAGILMIKEVLA